MYALAATISRLVFGVDDNDAAIVRRMGHIGLGRIDILLYDIEEKWQIDKEISIFGWISVAMRCHHHIVFMHLLYGASTTSENEQTHYGRQRRCIEINEIASIAGGS